MNDKYVNALFTSEPDLYAEMLSWPNTPGHDRYIQGAREYLEWDHRNQELFNQGSHEYEETLPADNKELALFTDFDNYSQVATTIELWEPETMAEFTEDATDCPERTVEHIIWLLHQAKQHGAIGIAKCSHTKTVGNDQTWVTFSRMPRHPDWMGMSPIFHDLTGYTAFVFQEPETQGPAFVILANHPDINPLTTPNSPFGEGEPTALRDFFKKMAIQPLWVPWDGEHQGEHSYIPVTAEPVAVAAFTPTGIYQNPPELLFQHQELRRIARSKTLTAPSYKEMLQWPHTPGEQRYTNAHVQLVSHIHQYHDGEAEPIDRDKSLSEYTDLDHYMELHDATAWHQQAMEELAFLYDKNGPPSSMIKNIFSTTYSGSTQGAIAVAYYNPAHRDETNPIGHINFTRIPRDPDWMGMNPALAFLKHQHALIFQAVGSSNPTLIIVAPPSQESPDLPNHTPSHKNQQAQALAEILEFHQISSTWLPALDTIASVLQDP